MIKFFRKIRQDLLSKGENGKYLKYAIGEIVLVVIGILIALQINNWNEERKQFNAKDNIVAYLISDLEKDIAAFKRDVIRNQKSIDLIDDFLRTEQIDNAQNFISTIDQRYIFYPNSSKYKSIISTNQIELLDDATIDKVTTYYEYDYYRLNARVRDLDNGTKRIEEYLIYTLPKYTFQEDDENFKKDIIQSLENSEVYNLLSYSSNERKNLNDLSKSTKVKAEALLLDLKMLQKDQS